MQSIHNNFAYREISEGQLQIKVILQSLNIFLQKYIKTMSDYDLPKLFSEINVEELLKILLKESSYHITPEDLIKANTLNEAEHVVFDKILGLIN
ncbi:10276_t:CDS:2 [Acaulospora colombiana]|uniref:10276_t:CDS:1 n=1 Tax=Acaulospora colombiana TaxID=27376 RepID=A0ACA9JXG8_9GLOM|nr:10276_t:CDS:2 [Acaulospora colombiana]